MPEKKSASEKAVDAVDALAAEAGEADPTVDVRGEHFTLVKIVPGIVLMRLSAAGDPKTPQPKQMGAILAFLERVVVAEERDAFMATLEDADPPIEFDELSEILTQTTEVLAGRPTPQ